jgi:hypothetical protein
MKPSSPVKKLLWLVGGLLLLGLVILVKWRVSDESPYYRSLFAVYYRIPCPLMGGDPRCSVPLLPYDERIAGADPWSFEVIPGSELARDDQFIYCPQRIDKADRATFRPLGGGLFADRNSVRRGCLLLLRQRSAQEAPENFDPATLQPLPCNFLKDATGVYRLEDRPSSGITERDTHAAFDRRVDVYKRLEVGSAETIHVDERCNIQAGKLRFAMSSRAAGPRLVLVGATEPGAYEDLGCGYLKVNDTILFGAEPVTGADPATFMALSRQPVSSCGWGQFGKDQHSVWWGLWKIEGADAASFMIVPDVPNSTLACDKHRRYAQGQALKPEDPQNRTYARQFEACPKG